MQRARSNQSRNYLRVRGEYKTSLLVIWAWQELPPRARRIPSWLVNSSRRRGTTSACAENTRGQNCCAHNGWNYLRVRGEYQIKGLSGVWIEELPPRARRILQQARENINTSGTTSACAENTGTATPTGGYHGNYLRVRGEYAKALKEMGINAELPPRARRIP